MYNPAIGPLVLKMIKPGFAVLQLNPGTLMGTVDIGFTLVQHHPIFIRSVNISGP